MAKFRKKPVVIEAMHYDWDDQSLLMEEAQDAAADFMDANIEIVGDAVVIPTLEGEMYVTKGDWIIRGVAGEYYPCKPDIFALTYEPA
jgi:hypothetical protein